MQFYENYDYLCDEPFYLNKIGNVKCPTLREIRKKTYLLFRIYLSMIISSKDDFLKQQRHLFEARGVDLSDIEHLSKFEILLLIDKNLLSDLLSFFICHTVEFENDRFIVFDLNEDETKTLYGYISNDNFDYFSGEIQKILGFKKPEEVNPKFKNNYAKSLFEKMQHHSKKQNKKADENFTIENMIVKYCTHNKVGINILNVWDMTFYQFNTMFGEYGVGRQADFNDMLAANTFSYKQASDYKPMDYMKKA